MTPPPETPSDPPLAIRNSPPSPGGNRVFWLSLIVLGGSYAFLVAALIAADLFYTTPDQLARAIDTPSIRHAAWLSLCSCTVTTLLALWTAVPLGYLLSRTSFHGKVLLDTIVDVPIVLPPLVLGLSLLILFQTPPGRWIEMQVRDNMGRNITYGLLPLLAGIGAGFVAHFAGLKKRAVLLLGLSGVAAAEAALQILPEGKLFERAVQVHMGTPITYGVPAVILAQFSMATAFAVRTMRATFDQISPRPEQVALTLGCNRSQAFWRVVLPDAWRGILTAGTLAWARSLGEFGPILIFAGATRNRTEVLSTTVFLELSIGNLEAAIAVSLLMIGVAIAVLTLTRWLGLRQTLPV